MGLIDRLRDWLGLSATDDGDEPADDDAGVEEEPRLDPNKVTEVRTESDDDPVEQLRNLEDDPPEGDREP